MKLMICALAAILFLACNNEEISYPKSYTLSHIDHAQEGLFVLSTPSDYVSIDAQTGTYGANRNYVKNMVEEFIEVVFDVREVELLSDHMVRLHWFTDEEEIDTIVTYTMYDQEIIIEALAGSNLLLYNSDEDQFEVCTKTQFAIPGPNISNPGQEYNNFDISECLPGYSPTDYIDDALADFQYATGDTLGILITKFIYR